MALRKDEQERIDAFIARNRRKRDLQAADPRPILAEIARPNGRLYGAREEPRLIEFPETTGWDHYHWAMVLDTLDADDALDAASEQGEEPDKDWSIHHVAWMREVQVGIDTEWVEDYENGRPAVFLRAVNFIPDPPRPKSKRPRAHFHGLVVAQ